MKTIIFSLFFLSIMETTFAQDGNWKISAAKAPNGSTYTGSVAISKIRDVHQLSWKTTGGNYTGVGIAKGNTLYAGYGINIDYGVVVYELKNDGSLDGTWTTNKSGGMTGTEKVAGGKALNGTFGITGTNAGSNSAYKGNLSIKKVGTVYHLTWAVGSTSYSGVGILDGNTLVVGWGFGNAFGVVKYATNGNAAKGIWAMGGGNAMGTEDLAK
jgi:hypothetical protein